MAKKFDKKYMHPTRRKLVDMVLRGSEYEKDTFISFSDSNVDTNIKRNVGDVWVDSYGKIWEQREYGKFKKSVLGDIMADVRNYLSEIGKCKDTRCDTIKFSRADKKTINKTGYCVTCLAKQETVIKLDGLWDAYETYRISNNMISHGIDVIKQLEQAYDDVKQEYEYVNGDGILEKWKMEKPVDELKSEIRDDIDNIKSEIEKLTIERDAAWELLKDKNYDLLNTSV
jgi:hypothetical protein